MKRYEIADLFDVFIDWLKAQASPYQDDLVIKIDGEC
jgi:hypothetical protein